MRRILLTIQYDGTNYGGWQTQPNAPTIQARLERELEKLTGEAVSLQGSGRTDSGVHALGQAAHFDTRARMEAGRFMYALNAGLPGDIRVSQSVEVEPSFHARFSAKRKAYRYTVDNGPFASALYGRYRLHVHKELDVKSMEKACGYFRGVHDFTSFMAAGRPVESAVRELYQSRLTVEGSLIYYDVEGSGFLYNMVRIMAGTLLEIGKGKYAPEAIQRAIEAKDRSAAGPTAPAHGLCLMGVEYPGGIATGAGAPEPPGNCARAQAGPL